VNSYVSALACTCTCVQEHSRPFGTRALGLLLFHRHNFNLVYFPNLYRLPPSPIRHNFGEFMYYSKADGLSLRFGPPAVPPTWSSRHYAHACIWTHTREHTHTHTWSFWRAMPALCRRSSCSLVATWRLRKSVGPSEKPPGCSSYHCSNVVYRQRTARRGGVAAGSLVHNHGLGCTRVHESVHVCVCMHVFVSVCVLCTLAVQQNAAGRTCMQIEADESMVGTCRQSKTRMCIGVITHEHSSATAQNTLLRAHTGQGTPRSPSSPATPPCM